MAWTEARLRRRARLAYELARLGRATLRAWPIVPLTAIATLTCGAEPRTTVLLGALLAAATIALRSAGGALGRAVFPGLLAGLLPLGCALAAPTVAMLLADSCTAACRLLTGVCVAGGLGAGVLLAFLAGRQTSLVAAVAVAALTGSLGCTVLGGAALAGVAAGLCAGALPAALRRSMT